MDLADHGLQRAEEYLTKARPVAAAYERLCRAVHQVRGEDPQTVSFCLLLGAAQQLERELKKLED